MTASKTSKALVTVRAGGRCERCGADLSWPYSFHHRRPRGMGGTSRADSDSPANLLLLCGSGVSGCHGAVESGRRLALDQGFLVSQYVEPAQVEVLYRGRDWIFLGPNGELLALRPAREVCS